MEKKSERIEQLNEEGASLNFCIGFFSLHLVSSHLHALYSNKLSVWCLYENNVSKFDIVLIVSTCDKLVYEEIVFQDPSIETFQIFNT